MCGIPAWSATTTVTVNGEAVENVAPGRYVTIERTWTPGDVIELTLDMTPRALRGDEHVDYGSSLYHGPLLLAYDQKFNTIEPDALPALDMHQLSLRPVEAQARYAPMVAFEATAADRQAMKAWRDALAETFGYRHPDHDDYVFHVTLAYMIDWLPDERLEAWQALFDECCALLHRAPRLELRPPAFCSFEDMKHFKILRELSQ